jgi:hypothetical protein
VIFQDGKTEYERRDNREEERKKIENRGEEIRKKVIEKKRERKISENRKKGEDEKGGNMKKKIEDREHTEVFHNAPCATLDCENAGDLENDVLGSCPARHLTGELDANDLGGLELPGEAGHDVHGVRTEILLVICSSLHDESSNTHPPTPMHAAPKPPPFTVCESARSFSKVFMCL